jgi:regulator of sirC expression with transglutaminase-like and TPR domain
MIRDLIPWLRDFADAAGRADADLASAALVIPRLEYPRLDPAPYLAQLDEMGRTARARLAALPAALDTAERVAALNSYIFEELGFTGNRDQYEDPRNSFLNEVLTRRTGIPITLALVYIEVARRAGLSIEGVNFPGHFLVRCPGAQGTGLHDPRARDLIIDAFHGGAILSERDCRQLLERHVGEEAAFDPALLVPATKTQILLRMLLNLKRIYVRMRSFPQARDVTELLLSIDPSALAELRDRGLLAYHLNDFSAALRDLQTYLRLSSGTDVDEEGKEEHEQLWEHVKTLRRRVASLN